MKRTVSRVKPAGASLGNDLCRKVPNVWGVSTVISTSHAPTGYWPVYVGSVRESRAPYGVRLLIGMRAGGARRPVSTDKGWTIRWPETGDSEVFGLSACNDDGLE